MLHVRRPPSLDRRIGRPWIWLTLALLGCGEMSTEPDALEGPPVARALTSEVSIDAGRLVLPAPTVPEDGISSAQAHSLATAFLRKFGPSIRPFLEEQAGRPLDFDQLLGDPRVIFSDSPYEPVDASAPVHIRAGLGPAYIVLFRDQHGPAVAVSVSVYAEGYDVTPDGSLVLPRTTGNQVRMVGMSGRAGDGSFMAPEEAVQMAFEATGAKIAEAPTFEAWGLGFMPFVGSWRVRLDREIAVRTESGAHRNVREIYVEPDGELRVRTDRTRTIPHNLIPRELEGLSYLRLRTTSNAALAEARPIGPGGEQ